MEEIIKTIIYDIESNGLLAEASTIHCIGVKVNDEPTQVYTSRPIAGSSGSISDCLELLVSADVLVGHNVLKFDNAVIRKLYGIDLFTKCNYYDTLIASQLSYPNLLLIDSNNKSLTPKLRGSHSLRAWGERLGNFKDHHEDWSQLTEEMVQYCRQDIEVTYTLYNKLVNRVPDEAMKLEQKFAYIIQRQEEHGVLFDVDKAQKLHIELIGELDEALTALHDVFKPIQEWIPCKKHNEFTKDGKPAVLHLRQLEKGCHYRDFEDWGYYETVTFNPKSGDHIVKWVELLYGKQKWALTEKGSPKTSEDELLKLFKDKEWAKPLTHYLEVKKLLGQLAEGDNAWLKLVKPDQRLHGEVNTLGAVSRRCTHRNPNMAQVPSSRAFKGHECRELFTVPKGYKLVGCDADALELRTLSHYMARYDGGSYGRTVDSGDKSIGTDIHTVNQKAAGLPTRDDAKTFIYALCYGAGAEKLGTIIGGSAKEGNKIKSRFFKKIPALKGLTDGVSEAVKVNGHLKALDGNKYFIRSEHSALNTLLQGAGALVMKYYAIQVYDTLISDYVWGKDFAFVLNIHDEIQIECREDIADVVADVCVKSFDRVTETLNFRVPLRGQASVGNNWADTH